MNWEIGPISPVGPTIPNGKGDTNQGPDRVGIPHVVDLIFGDSTGPRRTEYIKYLQKLPSKVTSRFKVELTIKILQAMNY